MRAIISIGYMVFTMNVKEDITLVEQRYGLFSDKEISVIKEILSLYCRDFKDEGRFSENLKINPVFENGKFKFIYTFEGVQLSNCSQIILSTVSGTSSFFDFLVFKQENQPDGSKNDNLLIFILYYHY